MLFVEWTRVGAAGRLIVQGMQIDQENVVFRISPQYFARRRSELRSVDFRETASSINEKTLILTIYKNHDHEDIELGVVDATCIRVIQSYIDAHPLH